MLVLDERSGLLASLSNEASTRLCGAWLVSRVARVIETSYRELGVYLQGSSRRNREGYNGSTSLPLLHHCPIVMSCVIFYTGSCT